MKTKRAFCVCLLAGFMLAMPYVVNAGTLVETLAADFAANSAQENIDARRWQAGVPGGGPLHDGEIMLQMEWQALPAFPGEGPVSDLESFNNRLYAVTSNAAGGAVYVNAAGEFTGLSPLRPGASFVSAADERGLARLQRFARSGSNRLYGTGGADTAIIRILCEAGDGFADGPDLAGIAAGATAITALGDFTDLFGDSFLMSGLRGGNEVDAVWFEGRNWGTAWQAGRLLGATQVDFITGHEGFCYAAARGANAIARNKFGWLKAADWGVPVAMLSTACFPGANDDMLLVGHEGAAGNLIRYARGRVYDQGAFRTYAAETTPLGARVIRTSEAAPLGGDVYVAGNTDRASAVVLKYFADYDAWKTELETPAADRFFTVRAFAPAGAAGEELFVGGRTLENKGIVFRGRYAAKGTFQSNWKELAGAAAAGVIGDTLTVSGFLHDGENLALTLEVRGGTGRATSSGTYSLADRDAVVVRDGNKVTVSWPYRAPRGVPSFTGLRYAVELTTASGAHSPSINSVEFAFHENAAAAAVEAVVTTPPAASGNTITVPGAPAGPGNNTMTDTATRPVTGRRNRR